MQLKKDESAIYRQQSAELEFSSLRSWNSLGSDEQTAIRVEYGLFLGTLPPTCSLETKIGRFRNWLREHKGIEYRD